jgi:hypothetical protein
MRLMRKPLRYDPYLAPRDHALSKYRLRNSWAFFLIMLVLAVGAVSLLFLLD